MAHQLDILVKTTDADPGVFGKIAESVKGLEESGHGIHQLARGMEHAFLAAEVGKLGFTALTAVVSGFSGSAEHAAEAQRELFNSLKEIPIVGPEISEAAEGISAALSHAFGGQSTADIEANIKKQADAMKELDKSANEVQASLTKLTSQGLSGWRGELAKAQEDYEKNKEQITALRKSVLASSIADDETSEGEANLAKAKEDAQLMQELIVANELSIESARRDSEIKQQQDLQQFYDSMADITTKGENEITELRNTGEVQHLQSQHRALEAQLAAINANADKSITARTEAQRKTDEALRKTISEGTNAQADLSGNQQGLDSENSVIENLKRQLDDAQDELSFRQADLAHKQQLNADRKSKWWKIGTVDTAPVERIIAEKQKIVDDLNQKIGENEARANNYSARIASDQEAIQKGGGASNELGVSQKNTAAANAQEDANRRQQLADAASTYLNDTKLSLVQRQAEAGDKIAQIKAEQLKQQTEDNELATSYNAIIHDTSGVFSEMQKDQAQNQLYDLRSAEAAEQKKRDVEATKTLQETQLSALRDMAQLGNVQASLDAEKLQQQISDLAIQKQLNELIATGTDAQKAQAQAVLDDLEARKKLATAVTDQNAGMFVLQHQAAGGNSFAKRELDKLNITKAYAEELAKVTDAMKQQQAAGDSLGAARSQSLLDELNKQEALDVKHTGGRLDVQFADASTGGGDAYREMAREALGDKAGKGQEENIQSIAKILENLQGPMLAYYGNKDSTIQVRG